MAVLRCQAETVEAGRSSSRTISALISARSNCTGSRAQFDTASAAVSTSRRAPGRFCWAGEIPWGTRGRVSCMGADQPVVPRFAYLTDINFTYRLHFCQPGWIGLVSIKHFARNNQASDNRYHAH